MQNVLLKEVRHRPKINWHDSRMSRPRKQHRLIKQFAHLFSNYDLYHSLIPVKYLPLIKTPSHQQSTTFKKSPIGKVVQRIGVICDRDEEMHKNIKIVKNHHENNAIQYLYYIALYLYLYCAQIFLMFCFHSTQPDAQHTSQAGSSTGAGAIRGKVPCSRAQWRQVVYWDIEACNPPVAASLPPDFLPGSSGVSNRQPQPL